MAMSPSATARLVLVQWFRNEKSSRSKAFCILILLSLFHKASCKTVSGIFNPELAHQNIGQYVTSFAFHGSAILNFTTNATGTDSKLYLFLSEDWKDAVRDTNCHRRLAKARGMIKLNDTSGSREVFHFNFPRIWHLVFADHYTCQEEDQPRPTVPNGESINIRYTIRLFNPDSLGNPTEHFGDQETGIPVPITSSPFSSKLWNSLPKELEVKGNPPFVSTWPQDIYLKGLLKFYQLLTLTYFVVACIVGPQLYQTLDKGGPMQLVIQLLSLSMSLQFLSAFIVMFHFYRYSKDGIGSPYSELFSEFLDMLSQFTMLLMLLSLSMGWTLTSAQSVCRFAHFRNLIRKPAARVVGVLGIVQGLLFMWEQSQDQSLRLYRSQRSYVGITLVVLRTLMAAMFAIKLRDVIRSERSKLKRQFYASFTKLCLMWFLCYPVIVICSWIFSEYLQYKLITMCVLVCQWISGVLLYRLFLSRSLYWEVSALSSSLPFRFDHKYGMKLYS